jgi:hypothetical protein
MLHDNLMDNEEPALRKVEAARKVLERRDSAESGVALHPREDKRDDGKDDHQK